MSTLIVIGAVPGTAVRQVLETALKPEELLFTTDPFDVADTLVADPQAVLAYTGTPLVDACTAQGVRFERAKRIVVLGHGLAVNPDEGGDTTFQAAIVLGAQAVLDLAQPAAVEYVVNLVRAVPVSKESS